MNVNKQPDPKTHLYISLVKSAFRIIAGLLLVYNLPIVAGGLIIIAEVLGILEEIF